jgi:hypothetical protein
MFKKSNIPPIYMWLVCKFFFIIIPTSLLLSLSLATLGFPNSIFTSLLSGFLAFFASNSYDKLTISVRDWVKEELR